ncbi:MAG: hypothetical protein NTU66_02160 [Elusimicrobia bacterium]|nr:hypothetical protein [Elusimicrobiota bacterium]
MKRTVMLILMIFNATMLFAEGNLSIGLGWPYVSVKGNLSPRFATEARYAAAEGIKVYAGRLYWNFSRSENIKLFTGLEGGWIEFDTFDIHGAGYEGSLFVGGEYFVAKNLSFMMDFCPTVIALKSDDVSVDGIEWTMNLAIHYYLF